MAVGFLTGKHESYAVNRLIAGGKVIVGLSVESATPRVYQGPQKFYELARMWNFFYEVKAGGK